MTNSPRKVRAPDLTPMNARGERIVMLTAYDATMARILDQAGIDVLLVGDSLGQVILGLDTTRLGWHFFRPALITLSRPALTEGHHGKRTVLAPSPVRVHHHVPLLVPPANHGTGLVSGVLEVARPAGG